MSRVRSAAESGDQAYDRNIERHRKRQPDRSCAFYFVLYDLNLTDHPGRKSSSFYLSDGTTAMNCSRKIFRYLEGESPLALLNRRLKYRGLS